MQLNDQIRTAREKAGMSKMELALILGKSVQAITYWEDGSHMPRLPILKQLEEVLHCRLYPTGEFPVGTQEYLSNLTPEDVELAKAISTLPKVVRHAIVTLIKSGSWNVGNTSEVALPEASRNSGKKKMIFHMDMDKGGNDDLHSARQSLNVDAKGPKKSQAA